MKRNLVICELFCMVIQGAQFEKARQPGIVVDFAFIVFFLSLFQQNSLAILIVHPYCIYLNQKFKLFLQFINLMRHIDDFVRIQPKESFH